MRKLNPITKLNCVFGPCSKVDEKQKSRKLEKPQIRDFSFYELQGLDLWLVLMLARCQRMQNGNEADATPTSSLVYPWLTADRKMRAAERNNWATLMAERVGQALLLMRRRAATSFGVCSDFNCTPRICDLMSLIKEPRRRFDRTMRCTLYTFKKRSSAVVGFVRQENNRKRFGICFQHRFCNATLGKSRRVERLRQGNEVVFPQMVKWEVYNMCNCFNCNWILARQALTGGHNKKRC